MADVGAKQRVNPRTIRIVIFLKRPGVDRIIRLAAEIETIHEQIAQVLLLGDLTRRVVIKVIDPAIPADIDRFDWPKRGLIIVAGLVFGLAMGALVAAGKRGAARI